MNYGQSYGGQQEDPYDKRREARDRKMAGMLQQGAGYAPGVGTAIGTLGGAVAGGIGGYIAGGGQLTGIPTALSGAAAGAGVGGAAGGALGGLAGMGMDQMSQQMLDPYEQRRLEREQKMATFLQTVGPYTGA